LDRAAVVLAGDPINRDATALGTAINEAERTLAEVPLHELAKPDLLAALEHLHSTLDKLKSAASPQLLQQVQRLLAAVQSAEVAAKVGASADPVVPSGQQTLPVPTLEAPGPAAQLPDPAASPDVPASIPPGL
jgi:hypothetical protein